MRSVLLALVLVVAVAGSALSVSDQVSPAQDNPSGCTTATSSTDDGCGAQGRNNTPGNAGHVPPITACRTTKASSGSVITRILPTGPYRSNGTLAFITGACVYLPPGYDKNTTTHYPVIYMLHGGGGDEADWVTYGGVRTILDRSYAANHNNAVIAVMPDGRDAQWYDYYNRNFLIETYVLNYLIPFVDRHFRTIPDRKGRAVVGLSNGGYGAMDFAAKRPDMFTVAGSMSGNVGARSMGDLGTPIAPGAPVAAQEAGTYYYGNEPIDLATNLDNVNLIQDWGASCSSDLMVDGCGAWLFEQSFRYDNQNLHNTLVSDGHVGAYDYRETEGGHAWRWWTLWFATRDLPFALSHMWKPTTRPGMSLVPSSFRFRSIAPSFSIWGYRFAAGTNRASEFLDLSNVRSSGMVLTGSGTVNVMTAARYPRGAHYTIRGTGLPDQHVVADFFGQLHFAVNLGPAHTNEEYSPAGREMSQSAGYFTTCYVTIASG